MFRHPREIRKLCQFVGSAHVLRSVFLMCSCVLSEIMTITEHCNYKHLLPQALLPQLTGSGVICQGQGSSNRCLLTEELSALQGGISVGWDAVCCPWVGGKGWGQLRTVCDPVSPLTQCQRVQEGGLHCEQPWVDPLWVDDQIWASFFF